MKSILKPFTAIGTLSLVYALAVSSVLSVPPTPLSTPAPHPSNQLAPGSASKSQPGRATQLMQGLPLQFEPNVGQAESRFNFVFRGSAYSVMLNSAEAVFALRGMADGKLSSSDPASYQHSVTMKLQNANTSAQHGAQYLLPGWVNYFSAGRAQTNIPTYRR